MKRLLGYVSSTACEDSLKLHIIFEGPLKEKLAKKGVEVVDASIDAMAFADVLRSKEPEEVLLVGVKKRGRAPGFYLWRPEELKVEDTYALSKLAQATLTGWLDVDALIDGLRVFAPEYVSRIRVLECEPPCGDWERALEEVLE
ncbi:hypothetical protein [Ignicoccus hospitalis]|uniref:Uncharacterized protein n=1 Tax=Ignicoccus hospitalis (strain KIN4/I / DSM 18386 / JCM 14125) TaxID=453591 RepID=A8A9T4_IGNH4|nr:hypothetical protein [Ignicoccus hospitalis]ABU81686.1 hypothetical protein Igni_0503 [Ignicoccus hospitalis KIN4/I]HIH89803.1 hypothetical protein [Desulfurococcaceae archaeon]